MAYSVLEFPVLILQRLDSALLALFPSLPFLSPLFPMTAPDALFCSSASLLSQEARLMLHPH